MKVTSELVDTPPSSFRPYLVAIEVESSDDDTVIKELAFHDVSVPEALSTALDNDQIVNLKNLQKGLLKARNQVVAEAREAGQANAPKKYAQRKKA